MGLWRWALFFVAIHVSEVLGGINVADGGTAFRAVPRHRVQVEVNTERPVWDGWGTSLAWWAHVFGERADLADALFTMDDAVELKLSSNDTLGVPGLGLNIARYNLGGCSSVPYGGHSMNLSANMDGGPYWFRAADGYWIDWAARDPTSSSWDWSRDANQRSMIKLAQARGVDIFEMFSNSPMWWMCANSNPGGADDGSGNLQEWNVEDFAVYIATVAEYAQSHWDVKFRSVEAFNEPSSGWWAGSHATQEGCHIPVSMQEKILPVLRRHLDERGLTDVMIAASDENSYELTHATWSGLGAAAKSVVGRVNTHGYQYKDGPRELVRQEVKKDGKALWNSEYGDGDDDARKMAECLHLDMMDLQPSAYVYWQALDSAGWGLITANPGDHWVGGVGAKYYVFAQYSRHIRPGSTILHGSNTTVVAHHTTSNVLTLVYLNTKASDEFIRMDLSPLRIAIPDQSGKRRVSGLYPEGPKYEERAGVAVVNGAINMNAQAATVTTLELVDVK